MPVQTFDEQMLAIINDPNEDLANREIAAIALGKDPNSVVNATPTPTASSTNLVALNPDLKDTAKLSPPSAGGGKTISPISAGNDSVPLVRANTTFGNNVRAPPVVTPPPQSSGLWDKLSKASDYAFNMSAQDPNFQSGAKDISSSLQTAAAGFAHAGLTGAAMALDAKGKVEDAETIRAISSEFANGQYANGIRDSVVVGRDKLVDKALDELGIGASPVSLSSALKVDVSWTTYFVYGFYTGAQ
jgi:hypothetical protein